jgi:SAM-dependent methyltransferase
MKKVDFDKYTEDYNSLLSESTSFFSEDEAYFARYKVGIVKKILKCEPSKILEFGCGIGRNLRFLREAFPGSEIVGSDVSEQSLQVAAKENPENRFFTEGAEDAGREVFDLIFVAGVFHHISPLQRPDALQLLLSRTCSGGSIFIFEHNPYNPVTRRIVNSCPYDEDAVLLPPHELISLLEKAGFSVQSREFALFFPPKIRFLLPFEKYLGWLPLGGQYWVAAKRK